jgi:hypothetical protein
MHLWFIWHLSSSPGCVAGCHRAIAALATDQLLCLAQGEKKNDPQKVSVRIMHEPA